MQARQRGLIGDEHHIASSDSTGYESGHVSAYYGRRCGQKKHDFPKVSELIDTRSHLALAAIGERGPSPDDRAFHRLVEQAQGRGSFNILLADAGYDGEPHHRFLSQHGVFGIIPPKRGRPRHDHAAPGGMTRGYLYHRWEEFKPLYGQRWQSETRFSMNKRKLGSFLRGRSDAAHQRECQLRTITLNLMLEPHPPPDG